MQKCSELGSDLEVWQYLSRYGLTALKIDKGPEGHHLEQECHDQLKQALPSTSYDKLMVGVNRWLKSLDEKDEKTKLRPKPQPKPKPPVRKKEIPSLAPKSKTSSVCKKDLDIKNKSNNDEFVVDLCSDDDEINIKVQSDNLFDCNIEVTKSQILDNGLEDINLQCQLDEKATNGSENNEKKSLAVNETPNHVDTDDNEKCDQLTVGAVSKTYGHTNKKPKLKKFLIRVRTDLKEIATPSETVKPTVTEEKAPEMKEKIQIKENSSPPAAAATKRKLSLGQPGKQCDSTTETAENCAKKQKKDLNLTAQEAIEKASPDTTSPSSSAKIGEPSPVLGLNHILGLLDCVESYATWQHNLEAIDLLSQLRDNLKSKSQVVGKK